MKNLKLFLLPMLFVITNNVFSQENQTHKERFRLLFIEADKSFNKKYSKELENLKVDKIVYKFLQNIRKNIIRKI
jgi:hypothetical protein